MYEATKIFCELCGTPVAMRFFHDRLIDDQDLNSGNYLINRRQMIMTWD